MKEETLKRISTLFVIILMITTILIVAMSICKVPENIIMFFVIILIASITGMLISTVKLA